MNRFVVLTWVSWSWKTEIQKGLIKKGFKKPINFTTRKPRGDYEKDEYVFLTEEQYFKKLVDWILLEHTNSYWNWYWVSSYLPEGDICVVLDTVGRSQLIEKYWRGELWDYDFQTYFIDISAETQLERLKKRGDSEEEINKRKKDFYWINSSGSCNLISWEGSVKDIVDNIVKGV
jgi:guanylate kinase